jgi:hypothetical protein
MPCNCKTNSDIRSRCCPILNNADFLVCRARQDTALIHFENDYESYKKLEASIEKEENLFPIFRKFLSKFKLPTSEILMIANAWKVEQEEMMDDEEEEEEEEEEHPAHKFFEERDCAYCRAFFDQGKDTCKVCGFDLNSWSKKEEDSEDEEEETKPCFKCGKICGLKSMYCRNDAFYCDVNCYIDLQMKMYDTKIQTLKKPSVQDILKSLKKN